MHAAYHTSVMPKYKETKSNLHNFWNTYHFILVFFFFFQTFICFLTATTEPLSSKRHIWKKYFSKSILTKIKQSLQGQRISLPQRKSKTMCQNSTAVVWHLCAVSSLHNCSPFFKRNVCERLKRDRQCHRVKERAQWGPQPASATVSPAHTHTWDGPLEICHGFCSGWS